MKPPQRPPLVPGDVIRVEEPDYLYGVGPAVLRVTAVGGRTVARWLVAQPARDRGTAGRLAAQLV